MVRPEAKAIGKFDLFNVDPLPYTTANNGDGGKLPHEYIFSPDLAKKKLNTFVSLCISR